MASAQRVDVEEGICLVALEELHGRDLACGSGQRGLHSINHIGGLRRCCLHTLDDLAEDARGSHVGWWRQWYERWVCIIRLMLSLRQLGRAQECLFPRNRLARFHPSTTHSPPRQPSHTCLVHPHRPNANQIHHFHPTDGPSAPVSSKTYRYILMHVLPYSFPSCHAPRHV
jgi:hypothetical protein